MPRESMWATVRITWLCGRTVIRSRCGGSSASARICIDVSHPAFAAPKGSPVHRFLPSASVRLCPYLHDDGLKPQTKSSQIPN